MLNIHRPLQQGFWRASHLLPVALVKQKKSERLLRLQVFVVHVYIYKQTFFHFLSATSVYGPSLTLLEILEPYTELQIFKCIHNQLIGI